MELAALPVVAVRERLDGPEVWLVLRRTRPPPGGEPEYKYYLSNAPADTAVGEFAWASGMRWPIELSLAECKSEVGLDEYECRTWPGWHHPMTLVLLAHHFLVQQQQAVHQREGGPGNGLSRRGAAGGRGGPRPASGRGGATAADDGDDQPGRGPSIIAGEPALAALGRSSGTRLASVSATP